MKERRIDAFVETHRQTIVDALDFFTLAFGSLCALKLLAVYPDGGMSAGLAGGAAAGSVLVKQAIEKRYPSRS